MGKLKKHQTIIFKNPPTIIGHYAIVGPKEGQGTFKDYFDYIMQNDNFGENTFEKAERKMLEHAIMGAIDKAGLIPRDIDVLLCGDLLNQIISSSYAARSFDLCYLGVFGACSTMALSLAMGASLINAGYFNNVACATSSHFSSAERQFRTPLELGNQRPPTAQWTATAAGSTVLSKNGDGPKITSATFGKVIDFGVKDVNNMGAAMAPAAYHTLRTLFRDTSTSPADYDAVFTGDLGRLGHDILVDLFARDGIDMRGNYYDCGLLLFDLREQDMHCGGSGCGCSAAVLNGYLLRGMREGKWQRIVFAPTGALLSPVSSCQGESVPGICHAVILAAGKEET